MSTCRSCGAPILWATVEGSSKSMPLDPEPTPDGNIRITRRTEFLGNIALRCEVADGPDLFGSEMYTSHFATCPDADGWRRR